MKTATLILAAALALSAPAARAEEGGSTRVSPADLEERFYRAYYAENGLRDFPKAAEAYAEVQVSALSAGRKDLAVRALLGRARCMQTMGKGEEARAAFANALELDPSNEEAKAGAAEDAGGDGGDADLEERMQFLVFQGLLEIGTDSQSAARELRLLGDRCLPVLARAVGARELATVEAAALYLASLDHEEARAILLRAMRDPTVVFRTAIARVVCAPTQDGTQATGMRSFRVAEVPVLAEAAKSPEAETRQFVANRLFQEGDRLDAAAKDLLLRLATDPDRSVRNYLWSNFNFSPEVLRSLVPALRRALSSEDAQERTMAASWAKNDPEVLQGLESALRERLTDPDAGVRAEAFGSLRGRMSEEELAGMLSSPDSALAAGAAGLLTDVRPWAPATVEAVLAAVRRAIRGEFPQNLTGHILELAQSGGHGALETTHLVDLYAASGAADAKAGEGYLGQFRVKILGRLRQPLNLGVSPQKEQAIALVEDGVEKTLSSGWALLGWVKFWNDAGVPAPRAWLRAAAAADPRARQAAYMGLLRSVKDPQFSIPGDSLPHLGTDLAAADPQMRSVALEIAERAPSPALAESLRAMHAAARGKERTRLLRALVAAAGRDAEAAVRAELASPDGERDEALRLLMCEIRTGAREDLDAFVEAGGDPGGVVDLSGMDRPADRDLLWKFAVDLPPEKYTGYFVSVAAPFVDGSDRVEILRRALGSRDPEVLHWAAVRIGDLRILDLWPQLLTLLESGNSGVREAAEKALGSLKAYAEMKSTLARFGKDEQEAAIRSAETLLGSDDALKRKGAVLALAAIGDRGAIPAILRALDDKDADVRNAALEALERLGGKSAPR